MLVILDARSVTDHFPGIGRYTVNLARAVAPLLEHGERLGLLVDPAARSSQALTELGRSGVDLYEVAESPFSLRQQWRVPSLLRRLQKDDGRQWGNVVYHSPYYLMPYRPAVSTAVTVYDLIPLLFPGVVSRRARLFFRLATWLALRAADQVIVVSQATRQDLLRFFPDFAAKVTTIPLAADPCFHPRSPEEFARVRDRYGLPPAYVLYLGSNKPHKNLVRLIEAYASVSRSAFCPPMVMAGLWDGRHAEPQQKVAELGLADRVVFLGPVADEDLPALYSGATLFAFPSEYEGFGLPVLEAMACGTPVITGRTSSLPEVTGDAALLVDPASVGSIGTALEQILVDTDLRRRLREHGLQQAVQFSWARTAEETLAVYRALAARGAWSQ